MVYLGNTLVYKGDDINLWSTLVGQSPILWEKDQLKMDAGSVHRNEKPPLLRLDTM